MAVPNTTTPNSNRRVLLLALVLATIAALVVAFFIVRRPAAPAANVAAPPPAPTVGVVVAARDIAEGEIVLPEAVETRQVPAELRNTLALTDPAEAIGKQANAVILAGEQVLEPRLDSAGDGAAKTFAREVPPGLRAVSVSLDEVSGVGALVQPGDRVDVIAHFEFKVERAGATGPLTMTRSEVDFDEDGDGDGDDGGGGGGGQEFDLSTDAYVVQNREVLAVSQALEPGMGATGAAPAAEEGGESSEAPTEGEAPAETPVGAEEPVARPEAASVTLLVTPEEAQRLALADNAADALLRLALRSPGDTTRFDVRPVQIGDTLLSGEGMEPLLAESLDRVLGDVEQPIVDSDLVILDASFEATDLTVAGELRFAATVKNVSDRPLLAGLGGAPEGYVYDEDAAYDTEGFFDEPGVYRIGLNVAGAEPQPFPWRWSIGRNLNPGEEATVTGAVKLDTPAAPTRYWLGIIEEPNVAVQDGVAVVEVEVAPVAEVRVIAERAGLLPEPRVGAGALLEVGRGTTLAVVGQEEGWYRVRSGEATGWIGEGEVVPVVRGADGVAEGEDEGPAAPEVEATPAATPVATPAAGAENGGGA